MNKNVHTDMACTMDIFTRIKYKVVFGSIVDFFKFTINIIIKFDLCLIIIIVCHCEPS